LPAVDLPETPQDQSGNILERIYLIEGAVKMMDTLFASFLSIRQSPPWEEELKRLAKWLEH